LELVRSVIVICSQQRRLTKMEVCPSHHQLDLYSKAAISRYPASRANRWTKRVQEMGLRGRLRVLQTPTINKHSTRYIHRNDTGQVIMLACLSKWLDQSPKTWQKTQLIEA